MEHTVADKKLDPCAQLASHHVPWYARTHADRLETGRYCDRRHVVLRKFGLRRGRRRARNVLCMARAESERVRLYDYAAADQQHNAFARSHAHAQTARGSLRDGTH